jgi:uncharacterized protein YndB with AHSA1/START domain
MKAVLYACVFLLVCLAVFIATRPADYRISRSVLIAAPAEKVFVEVNDLKRWNAWSPWAKIDPASKVTFDGPAAGKGARMAWAGNKEIGEGRMTITESRPAEYIGIQLEFFKPFKGVSGVDFTFTPEAGGTRVVWSTFGKNGFMAKAAGLFMNCEKMIGDRYVTGLTNLKSVVSL